MTVAAPPLSPAVQELRSLVRDSRAPRLRGMLRWAEEEIWLPDGPYQGQRFRAERVPAQALLLAAYDSHNWRRHFVTGPGQSGKSLVGFVIPSMWYLFERRESVLLAVPDEKMVNDKWRKDILPAIRSSRYREYLPLRGSGSRDGNVTDAVEFRNGTDIRFMIGGSDDKGRAGFTSRILIGTEIDGFDRTSGTSVEADQWTQLENRLGAHGSRGVVHGECTVSVERGRTWREIQEGTRSRIVSPCPHCWAFVGLERQHLVGWQEATTDREARRNAHWICPACGETWSETERQASATGSVLLHGDQEIAVHDIFEADAAGPCPAELREVRSADHVLRFRVDGEMPDTSTLGFRWSAANNMLWTAADVAEREWRAQRRPDPESGEREMCQFVWAIPPADLKEDAISLTVNGVMSRTSAYERGIVPADCNIMTAHMDMGKRECWWIAVAWNPDAGGQIVDYGTILTPVDSVGLEAGLSSAMDEFRDKVEEGWEREDGQGMMTPEIAGIDSGNWALEVYQWCKRVEVETGEMFLACKGYGASQQAGRFIAPRKRGKGVRVIGDQFYVQFDRQARIRVMHVNADIWKAYAHERLACERHLPTAVLLPRELSTRDHFVFAKHITAEKKEVEFVGGTVGERIRYVRVSSANHLLDCFYNACALSRLCGVTVQAQDNQDKEPPPQARPKRARVATPDGRPFLVTER